jgi:ribosomal protein S12 methylthiotransferase accessory factor
LTPTSIQLEGLDRHQRLIDSYKKLHGARAAVGDGAALQALG